MNTLFSTLAHFVRSSPIAILLTTFIPAGPSLADRKAVDLATFLSGHMIAVGQFQNYHDGSKRSLRVDIHGKSEGDAFRLVEDTTYSDGEKHHWVWTFSKIGGGRYIGQRTNLVGHAKAEARGNRISIAYRSHVPTKDGKIRDLDFNETFVFTQSGTADYKLSVSFLFIQVGQAHLSVRKLPP
jgi:hypothetical protein